MKRYPIAREISGPTAMWTRPDTGDAPVSTYSANDDCPFAKSRKR